MCWPAQRAEVMKEHCARVLNQRCVEVESQGKADEMRVAANSENFLWEWERVKLPRAQDLG